jgi:hypothetical protein
MRDETTPERTSGLARRGAFKLKAQLTVSRAWGANTATAYLLQQIQLLAYRYRHGLAPWSATGNRSAKPTFQFGGNPGTCHRISVISHLAVIRPRGSLHR